MRGAVPQYLSLDLHEREELLHRSCRPPLLPEAEQAARQHDGEDDRGVRGVVQEERDRGGAQEQEHDGAGKLPYEKSQGVCALLGCQAAGGVLLQP